jgi:hypothetical protein
MGKGKDQTITGQEVIKRSRYWYKILQHKEKNGKVKVKVALERAMKVQGE